MRRIGVVSVIVGVLAILAGGAPASATDYFSFTFSDLDGDFSAASMIFTASDDGNTDGEVTRLMAPLGDAFFAGSVGDGAIPGPASFLLQTLITNVTPTTADLVPGGGFLEIRDNDDDVIQATVTGHWSNVGGSADFNGLLENVQVISDDGTFDGPDGSSISMAFPTDPPFQGNIINLTFGGWFLGAGGLEPTDFNDLSTLTNGVVIPEPATLALFALGGLALLARSRWQ